MKAIRNAIAAKVRNALADIPSSPITSGDSPDQAQPVATPDVPDAFVTLSQAEAADIAALIDEQGQHEADAIRQERKDAAIQAQLDGKDQVIAGLQDSLRSERMATRLTLIAAGLTGGKAPADAIKNADEAIAILRAEPAP